MNNEHYSHYSMHIAWSEEDQAFLVILPAWADCVVMPVTHGATYEEAVKHGREVLEMLIRSATQEGEALPQPQVYAA